MGVRSSGRSICGAASEVIRLSSLRASAMRRSSIAKRRRRSEISSASSWAKAQAAGLLAHVDEPHDPPVEVEGREEHARGRRLNHHVRQLSGEVHVVDERRLAVLVDVVDERVVAAEALGEMVRAAEAELRLQAERAARRIERVESRFRRPPFLGEHGEKVLIVLLLSGREHGSLRTRRGYQPGFCTRRLRPAV